MCAMLINSSTLQLRHTFVPSNKERDPHIVIVHGNGVALRKMMAFLLGMQYI